jgi:hypothetical protein
MGYYGVFLGLQYRNDSVLTEALDANQYNASQTVTIRIPVAIPYMNNDTDFERVDGKFEHEGKYYRLIKQRYANDTLTIVCLQDLEAKRINDALSEYVNTFADNGSDQNKNTTISITFIKDYLSHDFSISTTSKGWESDVIKNSGCIGLIPSFTVSFVHPPERI